MRYTERPISLTGIGRTIDAGNNAPRMMMIGWIGSIPDRETYISKARAPGDHVCHQWRKKLFMPHTRKRELGVESQSHHLGQRVLPKLLAEVSCVSYLGLCLVIPPPPKFFKIKTQKNNISQKLKKRFAPTPKRHVQ